MERSRRKLRLKFLSMNNVDKNTFLSIDLNSISKNYKNKKKIGKKCYAASTVKADAYGLGVQDCTKSHKIRLQIFFVATTNGAIF